MKPPRDYFDCDPGWHYCPLCDRDGDFTPSAHGRRFPECEAKQQAEASEEAHMPKPLIALPCTARELEDALRRVCDHAGPWDGNVRVVLDKTRNGYNLEIETKGETK